MTLFSLCFLAVISSRILFSVQRLGSIGITIRENVQLDDVLVCSCRTSDDSLLWHKQTGVVADQNTVGYGMIYVDTSGTAYLHPTAATTAGVTQKRNASAGTPVVTQKQDTVDYTDVWALNTGDGSLRWHWHKSVAEGTTRPMLTNNIVYFAGNGVYALRATDGKLLWHVLQGKSLQGPALG